MRMSLCKEEWWPVYELTEVNKYDPVFEISGQLLAQYEKARDEFNAVQTILRGMYDRHERESHNG